MLGGFLGALFAVDGAYLTSKVAEHALPAAYECLRIVRAELGSDILMIGAAELAFASLLANPAAAEFE